MSNRPASFGVSVATVCRVPVPLTFEIERIERSVHRGRRADAITERHVRPDDPQESFQVHGVPGQNAVDRHFVHDGQIDGAGDVARRTDQPQVVEAQRRTGALEVRVEVTQDMLTDGAFLDR